MLGDNDSSDNKSGLTDKVNLDMWYTSGDRRSLRLIEHLGHLLESTAYDDIIFTPKIVSHDCGDNCDADFIKKNCLGGGKYCAMGDPEHVDKGRDVLLEDIWEYCLW